ncbi:MAG: C39 family peptidase [Chloroflexi bacterium]|nr:C39 family peptidase [Chloroflexota bacterium]
MTRILVDPEQLKSVSLHLRNKAADLNNLEGHVRRILGNLSWEARQKANVDGLVNEAHKQAKALTSQVEEMSSYLDRTVAAFLEADRQGVENLAQLPAGGGAPWWMNRIISLKESLTFLDYLPQAAKELWATILKPIYPLLPAGMAAYTSTKLLDSPAWIPALVPATYQGVQEERTNSERSGFGDLLEKYYGSSNSLETLDTPQATAEAQWWKNVPTENQHVLKYNGKPTQWGCLPTSTGMVLDYWHNQDQKNKTISAQQLLDLNIEDKEWLEGSGMKLTKIGDELTELGYESQVYQGSSMDILDPGSSKNKLIEEVNKGPVIANIRMNMSDSGYTHAVVVTGISEDGNSVRINDPYYKTSNTYSWEEFVASWGAKYADKDGKPVSTRNFLAIRPKS